ncbi:MAG TPA: glycosyltransferase [Candidatus Paceibacterota bacterium]|jgi:Glycosyltransferases involved in cell wall biogenesis
MSRRLTLSVVIPVYNEVRTIEAILRKVVAAPLPRDMGREIIIVDDASKDGTMAIVERLCGEFSLRILRQDINQGKGAAVRRGLLEATGDLVVIQDADLEYDPADYLKLVLPLVEGRADVVFGSRYQGKRIRDLWSINYVANRILTAVSNLFTGLHVSDMETCYKVFTRKAAHRVAQSMSAKRFDMEPEITAILSRYGFRVVEESISYDPRTAREGKKIKWTDGFPALWSIVRKGIPLVFQVRPWEIAFGLSLLALVSCFALCLGPHELGDTPTYLSAAKVLAGAPAPTDFVPNRMLTTFAPVFLISLFPDQYAAWFFTNALLYVLGTLFFFKLARALFSSSAAAYFSAMFLAANYGFLIFSLNYSMDVGGWAFYIFALYFLWKYASEKNGKDLFAAAAMIGVGGLFKEYAFLGAVAIAVYLFAELFAKAISFKIFARRAALSAAIALAPFTAVSIVVAVKFGYGYADWFGSNSDYYVYASRFIEYVKALGALHNLLALLAVGGCWVFWKQRNGIAKERVRFIFAALISCLPIFFWPAITERILTPTVIVAALFAGFLFKRHEKQQYFFLPILALYIVATFIMDSFLLPAIQLPF